MTSREVVLATHNQGKVVELREILGSLAEAVGAAGSRSASSVDQPNPRAPSPCPEPGW